MTPADKALYWVSPLVGDADQMGLEVMLAGSTGVTPPDRVVFANWKRLSDAPWSYDTSVARNFSLLPYSVNDSAVSQYYDPRPVAKGAETTITLALGKFTQEGFSVSASPVAQASSVPDVQASAAPVAQSAGAPRAPVSDPQSVRAELSTVNDILSKIDGALASGTPLSDDELAQVESTLKDLGSGAARYAPAAGK